MRMPRWLLVLTSTAIIAVIIYIVVLIGSAWRTQPPPDSVACTADAMQCPDGSYVGRVPPSCQFAQCPATGSGATTKEVTLALHETARTLDVSITPLSLVEDSRCPINAECVWAGRLRVSVQISSGLGVSTQTLELGTPATTEAETITLSSATPLPRAGVKIEPTDYRFVFTVSKR